MIRRFFRWLFGDSAASANSRSGVAEGAEVPPSRASEPIEAADALGNSIRERRQQFAKKLGEQLPTPRQVELLSQMLMDALNEIRGSGDLWHARMLAYAFHNLPVVMHRPYFSWYYLLICLEGYERQYPESGSNYIAQFDNIVEFV